MIKKYAASNTVFLLIELNTFAYLLTKWLYFFRQVKTSFNYLRTIEREKNKYPDVFNNRAMPPFELLCNRVNFQECDAF